MKITVNAPAKINLTLSMVGRRADGYHLLDSVMQAVSLCDVITVETVAGTDVTLTLCNTTLEVTPSNTALKAAAVFFREAGLPQTGLAITVEKHIPMQAGMGGGSADAAGVLVALNTLFKTEFTTEQLCRMGEQIGADVPFCIHGGAARATGIGEILTPLQSLPRCVIAVAKPPLGISTAEAYRAVDTIKWGDGEPSDRVEKALCAGNLMAAAQALDNDFERAYRLEEIEAIQQAARECGALGCRMTGSGSAVYALCADEAASAAVCVAMAAAWHGVEIYRCEPVATGPVIKEIQHK